MVKQTDSKTAI